MFYSVSKFLEAYLHKALKIISAHRNLTIKHYITRNGQLYRSNNIIMLYRQFIIARVKICAAKLTQYEGYRSHRTRLVRLGEDPSEKGSHMVLYLDQ